MMTETERPGAPERLEVPFALKSLATRQAGDGTQEGVFEGLASTFGTRDRAGDLIEPGAFRSSLASLGPAGRIKMLARMEPIASVLESRTVTFNFPEPKPLSPPLVAAFQARQRRRISPPRIHRHHRQAAFDRRSAQLSGKRKPRQTR